jgi:hypothetical protein
MTTSFRTLTALAFALATGVVQAQTVADRVPLKFAVEHAHKTGSCRGELTIDKWRFSYVSSDRPEDSREWKLTELREAESKIPTELTLKTRESSTKTLGLDRNYKFKMLGAPLDRDVLDYMNDRIN